MLAKDLVCCKITFITVKLALPLHLASFDGHLKNLLKSFTKAMILDVVPTKSPSEAVILLDKKSQLVSCGVCYSLRKLSHYDNMSHFSRMSTFPSAKKLHDTLDQ